ncbi:hypothetical protein L226DRAFT_617371 [Lentinus tigrinus ALCF2SS1-7]|uniref:uncharacterized protein n=1 Tax=Lentinus tigrinus ALCF2SS1-7 TaxID=1328758 RepID=UPI00116623F6|nr:hypothetical protein L226DRAFT_617371 [Lentinus tigrinus ALCF2SS1-7]
MDLQLGNKTHDSGPRNKKARYAGPGDDSEKVFTEEDVQALPQEELIAFLDHYSFLSTDMVNYGVWKLLNEARPTLFRTPNMDLAADTGLMKLMESPGSRRQNLVAFMNHPVLRVHHDSTVATNTSSYTRFSKESEKRAAEGAWKEPYRGTAADALFANIKNLMGEIHPRPYARFAAFTQSSGTGKSRAVDQLAKKVLCIPVTIGLLDRDAFPPVDTLARKWLLSVPADKAEYAQMVQAFLYAVFYVTHTKLKQDIVPEIKGDLKGRERVEAIARAFRQKMTHGMKFGQHGSYRRTFYESVYTQAEWVFKHCRMQQSQDSPSSRIVVVQDSGEKTIQDAAMALIQLLNAVSDAEPCIILSFDEAHELMPDLTDSDLSQWSRFGELRRALRDIVGLPIFTLFLSTTGKLEQFAPLPRLSGSARVLSGHFRMFPPIITTPLDALAERFPLRQTTNPWTLDQVASTHHMALLGRPMFAAMYRAGDLKFKTKIVEFAQDRLLESKVPLKCKLDPVEKLALLGVRLPFSFRVLRPSPEGVQFQRELVSDHLRLLLYADVGFSNAVTATASEPLLAEAAYSLGAKTRWELGQPSKNRQSFSFYLTLAMLLVQAGLDLGTRGEMLGATFCLDARDCATTELEASSSAEDEETFKSDGGRKQRIVPMLGFLRALIGPQYLGECLESLPTTFLEADEHKFLKDAFADGYMYFNHFIKISSIDILTPEILLLAISRGAAFICADGQNGYDLVIPFLIGRKLMKDKVSAIFIQVKNSRTYRATPRAHLFNAMNPRQCGLFRKDNQSPPPVLRMVFALASDTSLVTKRPQGEKHSSRTTTRASNFTAYDIWFAGADRTTFKVIQNADEEKAVQTILSTMRTQRDVLSFLADDAQAQAGIRQMQPLASTERDHLVNWVDIEDDGVSGGEDVDEDGDVDEEDSDDESDGGDKSKADDARHGGI